MVFSHLNFINLRENTCFLGLLSHLSSNLKLAMMQKNTFMRKHRNSSCYHFRVRIPLDLQKHFKDKKDFTISLRTGVYEDASRTATRLYTLSQIIFDKIRMQEVNLDHEGVKKILLVEITRNIKNAQLTKWESTTDVKKYESLLKIA